MSAAKKDEQDPKDEFETAAAGAKPAGKDVATGQAAAVAAVVKTEPKSGASGDAALVGAHDEVSDELIDVGEATHVTLNKDVVEEFYYPDTKRPSYRIKYHTGQVVSREVVEQHNRDVAARKAARERGDKLDPENPAGIDSTTLASGTFPGVKAEAVGAKS